MNQKVGHSRLLTISLAIPKAGLTARILSLGQVGIGQIRGAA